MGVWYCVLTRARQLLFIDAFVLSAACDDQVSVLLLCVLTHHHDV
jgi:hypothetical protein